MKQLVLTRTQLTKIKRTLIDGLTIASGAKSSATYYHNRAEQDKAIKDAVAKIYGQSKELPLILANQKGVTGKFIQEVLLNEFKETQSGGACNIVDPRDWLDERLSDKAILGALHNLNENGIPYVLRLFVELKTNKINNERARKIALGYIWGHPNLEFNSVKYRNKIAKVLKHVYGQRMTSILVSIAKKYVRNGGVYTDENERNIAEKNFVRYSLSDNITNAYKILLFIFGEGKSNMYGVRAFPIISEYFKAKTDITSVTKVPEEVLVGMISNKNHPQYDEMWSTKLKRETTLKGVREKTKVTSTNQQMRQTKKNKSLGVSKTVDATKVTDFMALYKTGYEDGFTDELRGAINDLAESKKINNMPYLNIGIILDKSPSMKGHKVESKNTPRAIADFTMRILSKSADRARVVLTNGEGTDLASAFLQLMKEEDANNQYDAIYMITDGYENQYEGLTNEVINTYLKETRRSIPIMQVSPIVGAETGANVRKVGEEVVTLAINSPMALIPQINAKLLELDTTQWLTNQVKLIEESDYSRVRRADLITEN